MKKVILKCIEYIVYSSTDGKRLSLMLNGFFNMLVIILAVFGIQSTGINFPSIVESIVDFVATLGAVISAWQIMYGAVRKGYLSFVGRNKSTAVIY